MVFSAIQEIRSKIARAINDSGAIVGTATHSGTNTAIAAGSHGVLLLPLQLKLLSGSTPDFDGTIPTSWISPPEFPSYNYDSLISATAITNLGAFGVPVGGNGGRLPSGYFYALMVAAQAPANIPNIQYRWKRYWRGRQWYIIYNNSTGDWDITNRDSWGTLSSQAPLGREERVTYANVNPSSVKHEFYAADSPGLGYGHYASDSQCRNGDYIDQEDTFTYKIQYSFDGTNWQDGTSLIFHQQITVQLKQNYTGNPSNDLNVQANAILSGDNDPTMTLTKAAFITGSGHVNLGSNANITGY